MLQYTELIHAVVAPGKHVYYSAYYPVYMLQYTELIHAVVAPGKHQPVRRERHRVEAARGHLDHTLRRVPVSDRCCI